MTVRSNGDYDKTRNRTKNPKNMAGSNDPGRKDEIQSIPPFKWFSLLLVPVPNSSPGSSQCLVLSILRGCNINKFAHDQVAQWLAVSRSRGRPHLDMMFGKTSFTEKFRSVHRIDM